MIAIAIYAVAMIVANLSVSTWGPWVSPINAFLFIGLDLTLRDYLHTRLTKAQMLALIAGTGLVTYLLNPAAGQIAVASAVAFTVSGMVDWAVFARTSGSWQRRANLSNTAGAGVDSLLFPALAFGALMPQIVLMQFAAKVAGGALWAMMLKGLVPRAQQEAKA